MTKEMKVDGDLNDETVAKIKEALEANIERDKGKQLIVVLHPDYGVWSIPYERRYNEGMDAIHFMSALEADRKSVV